ncbi:MAG TPA: 16S rRNA (uracil(1498)-N(3))-methyltransferase, partial [Geobacteraceae bacterium]|nr:16S rRNA (uracil(1498)-N(3))-methyltransferase [Geobacteraceae bacterium]
MRRFFIDEHAISEDKAIICGNLFCHMTRVLRLKIGTRVLLSDGIGRRHLGVIESVGKENLVVRLEESSTEPERPSGPLISLYQGLPKGSKMEFILQKCTELGVDSIIPFVAERSIARLPENRETEKMNRWLRIVSEAARQSNRPTIPDLQSVKNYDELIESADQSLKLLLWEEENTNRLKSVLGSLPHPETVAVMVGPEGGLTKEEVEAATRAGFIPVTIGSRILRTETAGMAMLAILQFFWGDMG